MFEFLVENKEGIVLLLIIIFIGMVFVQWFCWTTGIGRFKNAHKRDETSAIRYIVAELFVKVINDFRHLLALVITVIFAISLGYALVSAGSDLAQISDALQSVTSTLGGLIGAIIGYYFGESAAKQKIEDKNRPEIKQQDEEQSPNGENQGIVKAPSPKTTQD